MRNIVESQFTSTMIKLLLIIALGSLCQSKEYLKGGYSFNPTNIQYWNKTLLKNLKFVTGYTLSADKAYANEENVYYITNTKGYCISQDIEAPPFGVDLLLNFSVINYGGGNTVQKPVWKVIMYPSDSAGTINEGGALSLDSVYLSTDNFKVFTTTYTISKLNLANYTKFGLCLDSSSPASMYITKISLSTACVSGESKLTLAGGEVGCVPDNFISSNPNCYKFEYKTGSSSDFQCVKCDTNSPYSFLVPVAGGFKGCMSSDTYAIVCDVYDYKNGVFNCSQCPSGYKILLAHQDNFYYNQCLNPNSMEYIYNCSVYKDRYKCQTCLPSTTLARFGFLDVDYFAKTNDKCVPDNIIAGSYHCYYFTYTETWPTQPFIQCGACDPSNNLLLLTLLPNGYKGCLEACSAPDQIKELVSKDFACIPAETLTNSIHCSKFAYKTGTTNQFECAQCDSSSSYAQLVSISTGYKGCASSPGSYDPQCLLYDYSADLNCTKCDPSTNKIVVNQNVGTYVKCLSPSDSSYDSYCLIYSKNPFTCQNCASQTQKLIIKDGSSKCVPDSVVAGSTNCFVFDYKSGSKIEFECAGCDPSSPILGLVDLPNGFKGCVPKCSLSQWKALVTGESVCIPKDVVDNSINCFKFGYKSGSKTDFECAQCDASSANTQLVSIKGGYKGCTSQNGAYDSQCLLYQYLQSQFNCTQCSSSFTQIQVDYSPNIFTKCLVQGSANYDSNCYLYQNDQKTCKNCSSTTTKAPVVGGGSKCLSSSVVSGSRNCFVFGLKSGSKTDYECAGCDPSNSKLTLTLFPNGFKGCLLPCPANQTKVLTNGEIGCVPNDVLTKSINCFKFGFKSGSTTDFECAECNQTSTVKYLVSIDTGFKGCAQLLIPSVKLYKVLTTKDAGKNFFLVPSVCDAGINLNNVQKIAIPSLAATVKEVSGGICRSNYANIAVWQVENGKYTFGKCNACAAPKFEKEVVLVSTAETSKGCIYSSTDKAYDLYCAKYDYQQSIFNCSECKKSATNASLNFESVIADMSGTKYVKCLSSANPSYDTECSLYSDKLSCKQCKGGKIIVPVNPNPKVDDDSKYVTRCMSNSITDFNFDSNCEAYNTSFACIECEGKNYTLVNVQVTVDGKAKIFNRCMLNFNKFCVLYDIQFKCIKCQFQEVKISVNGQISTACTTSSSTDKFCDVFTKDFKCMTCVAGYELKSGKCIKKATSPRAASSVEASPMVQLASENLSIPEDPTVEAPEAHGGAITLNIRRN